ncbi:DUF805 domain-containing protein [Rhizobiaceae bacterium n13]|uniref:DUF805 domain-containing protein n=1 Tax=Ferirhizobium litorale TaxID=2927786 RepID=A0AAE3U0X5_9HYPH|nr:DUF805 domain-containing protein [Fererhizobium litorale]MDI7862187.1 DUF805 domain-containing protein [Fererhizobium litorale]MDI7922539.1 DUF805 domain-containing protein [Fererhizobium litorale]
MVPAVRAPDMKWLFFSPSGRAGRQIFILGWLFWVMVNSYIAAKLVLSQDDDARMLFWGAIFLASALLSVFSSVMLTIKRLHDVGMPGALAVCLFVPVFSIVALVALCVWPSNDGANAYGARSDGPKAP